MKTNPIQTVPGLCARISSLAVLLATLGCLQSSRAASASWNALPTNNNWLAAPTTNNWSTGAGTFPGATTGTSSADIATFNANSSITTINCASGFVLGGFIFDTANASAYTINTSGGTWRVSLTGNAAGATIRMTGSVVNKETITGQLRLASSGALTVINDSTTPAATLNITGGCTVNNSGNYGMLLLGGTNTGVNIMGAFTEQTPTSILGNLIKTNTGIWALVGNNTYHSNTIVLNGTLMLMGSGAIPNSTNIVINSGTLNISNSISNPNYMWVTNSGSLVMTNVNIGATPLTIGTLTASNATFHLSANGASPYTDISVSTALNAGPNITLAIDKIANLSSQATFTLISYAGADPNPANLNVTVPFGYTLNSVNVGSGVVTATITPPSSTALVWVGKTNSIYTSSWDTNKTKNWIDQATMSIPQFYVNPDTVQFDDTCSNSLVTLITTNTPGSLTFLNYNTNYLFNGSGKISGITSLLMQGSGSVTLTESGGDDFSGGVNVTGGTLILDNTNSAISGGLTVGGGTKVQIGLNDGGGNLPFGAVDDEGSLIFSRANGINVSTSITGGGTLTQTGNGTLTLSAPNSYTGVTTVNRGVLALTGSGTISNSASLQITNASFDVSGVTGNTLLTDLNITNTSITLGQTGIQPAFYTTTLESDGSMTVSNIINISALPGFGGYPATITIIKSANPITLTSGNFNFRLGSLPSASPAYTGKVSQSPDGTAILLTLNSGPIGLRPQPVTWAGVDNVSVTTNWSDAQNWQLPGIPVTTDNLVFDGTTTVSSSSTVNNYVDQSYTVASLTFNQTSGTAWHVTQIPAGNTLTVNGSTVVGNATGDGLKTQVAMVDAGTLQLDGNLTIGNVGATTINTGSALNLGGLSNFVYSASSGTITLGPNNRSAANLILANASNNITAGTLNANVNSSSSSASGTITLGAGTNILNIGTMNLGGERTSTTLQFPSGATTGGLKLRGSAGTDSSRATVVLGNRNTGGSSGTTTGTLSLNGFPVDVKMGILTAGTCNSPTPVIGNGIVQFDTGTMDISTINMATNSNTGAAQGAVTVGANGTLIVGTGGVSLVGQTSTGTATGSLTNNGGILICSNSITKSTASGTANVTFTGGTVNMVAGTIGTLALPIDNLTLNGGTTLQLTIAQGVTNIAANTVAASGTTTINIPTFVGLTNTATIPLIHYTSGDPYNNIALGTVPFGYTVGNGGALVDNTVDQTIDLVITPPGPFIWVGAVGSTLNGSWDFLTSNWQYNGSPAAYVNTDFPQFDDTASNFVVTLTTTVAPASLTVTNNAHDYTFNGTGKISGPVTLTKEGTGTAIIDNTGANDFTGGINIMTGSVQIGNNDTAGTLPPTGGITNSAQLVFDRTDSNTVLNVISGSGTVTQAGTGTNKLAGVNTYTGNTIIQAGMIIATNANSGFSSLGSVVGALYITNGGTLDIEHTASQTICFTNTTDNGGKQVYLAGAGVGGNGAIVNNGTVNQQMAFQAISLTANATIGGSGRWDMRVPDGKFQPVLNLNGFTLTKTGTNQMSMVALIVTNGGNIIINSGVFSFETTSTNSTTTITINSGGVMGHYRETAGYFTAPITLNGGMIRDLNGAPGSTNDSPITLTANSTLDLNVGSTDLIRLNGNIVESGGSYGLTKTNIGTYSLAGNDTYSGPTMIVQGTLILAVNGAISQSKLINLATNTTLDASQRTDQTLTLNAGQTLSGFGTVTGLVSAVSGSTIAPGSASSTGTLTFGNNVTLGGTNVMKVSRVSNATNDILNVNGTLGLSGTLNVASLGGTYVAGDSFKLFNASGGISGTFTATNLPVLGGGLGWDASNLASGILNVVNAVNTNPTNITVKVTGNLLSLTWPVDHIGWRLQVQTNSLHTGLNTNVSAWYPVPGSDSSNSNNITIDPSQATVFYRLVYP